MSLLPTTAPRRIRRRAFVAVASILTLVAVGSANNASDAATTPPSTPTAATPHCIARATRRTGSNQLQLSTPACYATFADVLQSVGKVVTNKKITPAQARDQGFLGLRAPSSGGMTALGGGGGIIGTHSDGYYGAGASFSVWGSDCYGGYINLTGWWANRVSWTSPGCPTVVHYYWPDLQGSFEGVSGSARNLSTLDNLSESISYSGG